jgi:mono/diheme cytochrome c family protein
MRRAVVSVLLVLLSSSFAAVPGSVWDGVYTKQQAGRGLSGYREECLKCHGENLMGGEAAAALAGDEFLQKWNGKTAGDLFELIRKTMPSEDPGGLSRRQYGDILAYILSVNGFPGGQKELESETESLNGIRIEAKR